MTLLDEKLLSKVAADYLRLIKKFKKRVFKPNLLIILIIKTIKENTSEDLYCSIRNVKFSKSKFFRYALCCHVCQRSVFFISTKAKKIRVFTQKALSTSSNKSPLLPSYYFISL